MKTTGLLLVLTAAAAAGAAYYLLNTEQGQQLGRKIADGATDLTDNLVDSVKSRLSKGNEYSGRTTSNVRSTASTLS